ncbi:MAG: TylF/MycF/NovP-related O-methyltransferase [Gammaproteobacteria bacterium]|nr:TylF/MycF/NovP-related O-methyltransferase [Gammaproteobacteria bacterium]
MLKFKLSQESSVWKVRISDQVRCWAGNIFHLFLKLITSQLRGYREHSTLISNATYSPWRVDNEFLEVFKKVASHSLLDKMRLYELWQLTNQVSHLAGDAIEVGCWRGGAGCMMAARLAQDQKETTLFLCDTFRGVVKAGKHDTFYHGNEFANSNKTIVANLATSMNLKNVKILAGIFPEETSAEINHHLFKFAHIDVDVYQSARDAFEWLLPRLVDGAIVVFDDYGFSSTDGIRTYVDELQGRPDIVIIRNLNGQAVLVKR